MVRAGFVTGIGLVGLACGGAVPDAPAPVEAAAEEGLGSSFAGPPFADIGVPGPPWDQGTAKDSSSRGFPSLTVTYKPAPGSLEEVVAAWRAASLAKGWSDVREHRSADSAYLKRPGARLRIDGRENGSAVVVKINRDEKRLVEASWPVDPFCPEGTRLDPQRGHARTCFRVGTEMVEEGPHERVRDGLVVERGQHRDELRVGTWTSEVTDVDDVVYDVVTEYGAERTTRTWRRRDTGALVLTEALRGQDEYPQRHGPSVWQGGATVNFDLGEPDPAFAEAIWTRRPTLRIDLDDELELLDVDPARGHVAYRILDRPNPESGEHDCEYPGLPPMTGVVLGLYVAAPVEIRTWTVYAAATDAEGCTSDADATRALAEAKAAFTELGLDPTRKPVSLPVGTIGEAKPREPRTYTVVVGGRTVSLATEWMREGAPIQDAERVAMGVDLEVNTAIGRWSGIERAPLFLSVSQGNAGDAAIALAGAWEADGRALLGWRGDYQGCCAVWGFVPVP